RRSLFISPLFSHQESSPVSSWFRQTGIPNSRMRRNRLPDAAERHSVWNIQMAGEEISAPRGVNLSPARLARAIQSLLKGRSIVALAVALRAKIEHRVVIRRSGLD